MTLQGTISTKIMPRIVDILIFRRQRSQDFRGIYGAEGGPLAKH